MDIATIILINIGIIVFLFIFYIIWNLMRKNEKLEDALNKRDQYIDNMSLIMSESDRKIKEIDSKQIFESDDEIGWFFKGIKEIQTLINEYNSNK
tara:strand:+ start:21 stop:305 length:285 start_codon:yes stop_codon:yes gene_type:complete